MKFQALKAPKTLEISKHTNERFILPEYVIELRWIHGTEWCQVTRPIGTNWKDLLKASRILKTAFKAHLAKVG